MFRDFCPTILDLDKTSAINNVGQKFTSKLFPINLRNKVKKSKSLIEEVVILLKTLHDKYSEVELIHRLFLRTPIHISLNITMYFVRKYRCEFTYFSSGCASTFEAIEITKIRKISQAISAIISFP